MRFTTKRVTLALAMLLILASAMGVYSEEPEIGVRQGQKAPDFTLPVVGSDEEVTLSEEIEKYDVTILYFFFAAT